LAFQACKARKQEKAAARLEVDGSARRSESTVIYYRPYNNFQPQILRTSRKNGWQYHLDQVLIISGRRRFRPAASQRESRASYVLFVCTAAGDFIFASTTQLNGDPPETISMPLRHFCWPTCKRGKVTLFPPEYHATAISLAPTSDQWQATRKLTLTYGTRWEYYPFPTRGDRGMEYLNAQTNQ